MDSVGWMTRSRVVFVGVAVGLVAALGLASGQGASGKPAKKPKLGKEGSYAQTFANGTKMWRDDTSITVFTRGRKVIAVWVTSNYKLDGGEKCWPIGSPGTLLPDKTTMGPVPVQIRPKSPVSLNAKNSFTVRQTVSNPFYDNGGGSITGKLLPSGRMSVTARLSQAANGIQGRCSTVLKTPKAKFKAFKVGPDIG